MNKKLVWVVFVIALICILAVSGCIAPPKEAPLTTTTYTAAIDNPNLVDTTSTISAYVSIETPYVTQEPTSTGVYRTVTTVLPVTEDYVVIYSMKNQPFAYNKTAVSFDLKNPPMLIDFTVSSVSITRNIEGESRAGGDAWTSIQTSYVDPNAYFEVTVREKSTGKIVLQDGFGQSKQYGTENTRHLKVFEPGDFLIEFSGNKLTASLNLSVKREVNINQSVA